MSPRLPPRREPRALTLIRSPSGFHYATADPWELRSAGSITCRDRALAASVARIVRREKPTVLVARGDGLAGPAKRAARRHGLAVVGADLPTLRRDVAQEMYPELPLRAPSRELERAAILAIAAVLYADTPPRRYAPTRNRPPEHAS
jgi:hypothetical protein